MADQNITALPVSTTPESSDQLLLVGATEEKLIDYDKLADAILNKLTSKNFSLDQGTMPLISALNQLNSKALRYKNANVTDWNNVIEIGIYSGNNAANSPTSNMWINAICLSSNSNTNFLHLIAFTINGHIYSRYMIDGKWEAWILIK